RSLRPTSFSHNLTIAALSFANSSYCQACSGLSPPSFHPCRAHIRKRGYDKLCQPLFFLVSDWVFLQNIFIFVE
ncbi:hypothetical protein, partial [Enterococcus faecium]|uniref:hypothetical protein n=1 Tax=Enterococcus faecium TaxID=1352 RepID=UPI0029316220